MDVDTSGATGKPDAPEGELTDEAMAALEELFPGEEQGKGAAGKLHATYMQREAEPTGLPTGTDRRGSASAEEKGDPQGALVGITPPDGTAMAGSAPSSGSPAGPAADPQGASSDPPAEISEEARAALLVAASAPFMVGQGLGLVAQPPLTPPSRVVSEPGSDDEASRLGSRRKREEEEQDGPAEPTLC